MKFGIVRPRDRVFDVVDTPDTNDAKIVAGLDPSKTDHSRIWPGLAMICDEHAMFAHPQFYFAINRTLFAGNVVLYAFDEAGRTINFDVSPARWFGDWLGDEDGAEQAIQLGRVERPRLAIGGKVFWSWPQPMPDMDQWARMVADKIQHGHSVLIDGDTLIAPIGEKK